MSDYSADEPRAMQQTTRCPACAEVILSAARKCKHCGEALGLSGTDGQMVIITKPSETSFSQGGAAVLSFFIPGAGQIYRGKIGIGIGLFLLTIAGYVCFVIPGFL